MADLQAYQIGLAFMGRILQEPPDEAFLREFAAMPSQTSLWPGMAQAELAELLALDGSVAAGLVSELSSDHLRLFSGPDPIAPPWESVWREKDGLLFGKSSETTAAIYQDWGMEISAAGHEPEDHLGLQLAFMGYLASLAGQNPPVLSQSGQKPCQTLKLLLNEHVLAFAPAVLAKAVGQANSVFYQQACENCAAMLGKLEQELR